MNNKVINRIYELKEKPILLPSNLVENIKLENYSNVNFTKNSFGVVCTMLEYDCEKIVKYIYQFNENDYLMKITAFSEMEEIELFDREEELSMLLAQFDPQLKLCKEN